MHKAHREPTDHFPQPDYLRIENVTKMYDDFAALDDVSLTIERGEFICFLGPSGCGKTTLLRIIAGLEEQTQGLIIQNGEDVSNQPPNMRDFGIVFQSYALFPNLSVEKNIAYGLENLPRVQRPSRKAMMARVTELIETVGLQDHTKKYPAQLSGGQQQRVALARALACEPGLLLLDEPLSALDAKVRQHLRTEIHKLQRTLGVTTIMVTHDQEEALAMADRIVVMSNGKIEQIGTPTEIYQRPATPFVAEFVGNINLIDAVKDQDGALGLDQISYTGAQTKVCLRPEDIICRPKSQAAPDMFEAYIQDVEFLGAFYRTHLSVPGIGAKTIMADIGCHEFVKLEASLGDKIYVRLLPERLRTFDAEKEKVEVSA
ncbi:putative 2-aminoethylphosphonate ABC transporter ATP-binding protein [Terasakiella pusilla]|jgi:iron(III) transport system ATP-binding protein|uniref:putative 2-aminoethylphosphonate ABC transporter ATP-binding protein n=1 Tax=Terasakiella pusilla TaxID=64973 RepID=UPI00068B0FC5|nr:putative 2-aminoethylphosphonate ABC transporter ATP-binding protein [Terasakiella pusilla]